MKKEIIKFILVGCSNTIIGIAIIYFLYNILKMGYWVSSGCGYIIGSIWSYFMNKNFTFQYKNKNWKNVVRFIINIILCYVVAYAIAKPMTMQICRIIFTQLSLKIQEEMALLVGMGLYTVLNFLGQKFFCFRLEEK